MYTYEQAFTALADPTRRSIFERMLAREVAVGELAAGLPVSRPAVSQHLKVLEAAGLAACRQEGTRRLYRADGAGLMALRLYLESTWSQVLTAFGEAAERQAERDRKER